MSNHNGSIHKCAWSLVARPRNRKLCPPLWNHGKLRPLAVSQGLCNGTAVLKKKIAAHIHSAIKTPTWSIWWEHHPCLSLCLFPSLSFALSPSIRFDLPPSPQISISLCQPQFKAFLSILSVKVSLPPVCLRRVFTVCRVSRANTCRHAHSRRLWIFHAVETAGSKTALSSSGLRANIYFPGWVQEGRGPAEIR